MTYHYRNILIGAIWFMALSMSWAMPTTVAAQDQLIEINPESVDTIIPTFEVDDTPDATARHVTIREIIRKATRGERTKLAGHDNMTYIMTVRNIVSWNNKKTVEDAVFRAYTDSRGVKKTIQLDRVTNKYKKEGEQWVDDNEDSEERVGVRASVSGIDDFSRIPFFLRDEQEYDFTLLDRTLEEDRVIFKIGFRPRSDFKPLPSGIVYVDTKKYQIIHEEFWFDQNPVPTFLKGIKRVSRHWAELSGGEWVFTKVLLELDLRTMGIPYIPGNVTSALIRDLFEFDTGYDPRLFGDLSDASDARVETDTDSLTALPASGLLGQLQSDDATFFKPELLEVNTTFRDTTVARHDSMGLDAFSDFMDSRFNQFGFEFGIPTHLVAFNRVEGLVTGASLEVTPFGEERLDLNAEGAYAFGSSRFRYYGDARIPLTRRATETALWLSYQDRVLPYGSNRPAWNDTRALIGGADEQDYLRREGGGIGIGLQHISGVAAGIGFHANKESSVSAATDFSVFGNPSRINAPIDEGTNRTVTVQLSWRAPDTERQHFHIQHQSAGSNLGGDFVYERTDVGLDWRQYIVGRHELFLQSTAAFVTGGAPVQHLADVGGLSTVRGYPRRSRVGKNSFAGRLEYLVPYDVLKMSKIPLLRSLNLQVVPWADAGRTWKGDRQTWLYSTGIGIQRYLGPFGNASNLRLDLSFPLGYDRPENFRVDLHFTAGMF